MPSFAQNSMQIDRLRFVDHSMQPRTEALYIPELVMVVHEDSLSLR